MDNAPQSHSKMFSPKSSLPAAPTRVQFQGANFTPHSVRTPIGGDLRTSTTDNKPSSEKLSLLMFLKKYQHNLPIPIHVCRGFFGPSEESDTSISMGDRLYVHFVKHSPVVCIEYDSGLCFNISNSGVRFGILYNPHNNINKAMEGYQFDKVSDLLQLSVLPVVLLAKKPHIGQSPVSSVVAKEVLIVKKIHTTLMGIGRQQLKVYSLTQCKEKTLSSNCEAHFSTKPSDVSLFLPEIAKHIVPDVFPCKVVLFDNSMDISPTLSIKRNQLPHRSGHITKMGMVSIVTMMHSSIQTSIIATSALENIDHFNARLLDIPIDLDILVCVEKDLDKHEADCLYVDTFIYEHCDPTYTKLYPCKQRSNHDQAGLAQRQSLPHIVGDDQAVRRSWSPLPLPKIKKEQLTNVDNQTAHEYDYIASPSRAGVVRSGNNDLGRAKLSTSCPESAYSDSSFGSAGSGGAVVTSNEGITSNSQRNVQRQSSVPSIQDFNSILEDLNQQIKDLELLFRLDFGSCSGSYDSMEPLQEYRSVTDISNSDSQCKNCPSHDHAAGLMPDMPSRLQSHRIFRNLPIVTCYYKSADRIAHIPFVNEVKILTCDSFGLEYHDESNGISIHIPHGSIPAGIVVNIEIAIALYGPFTFAPDEIPISPILWLCPQEDIEFLKPFKVTLPHFLTGLTEDESCQYRVTFGKAKHTDCIGSRSYHFQEYSDASVNFVSNGEYKTSCGTVLGNHCCLLCIKAKKSEAVALKAGYSLYRVERSLTPRRQEISFCATLFLPTCYKQILKQYPQKDGYHINEPYCFKFEDVEIQISLKVTCEEHAKTCCTITSAPANGKIKASNIHYWNFDLEELELKQETKNYPPSVKLTVDMKDVHSSHKLKANVIGCTPRDDLDVEVMLPFVQYVPLPVPIASSQVALESGNCHIDHESAAGEKPLMSDLLKELLGTVANEWENIGLILELKQGTLDAIKSNYPKDAKACLREMLKIWLQTVNPPPTWSSIIDAIKSIGNEQLAQQLQRKYC